MPDSFATWLRSHLPSAETAGAFLQAGKIYLALVFLGFFPDSLQLFNKWMVWFEDPTNAYRIWWFHQIIYEGQDGSIWFLPLLNYPDGLATMWASNGIGKELVAAVLGGGLAPWLAMNLISFTTPVFVGLVVFGVLRRRMKGLFLPPLVGGALAGWSGSYTVLFVSPWVVSLEGLAWFLGLLLLMRRRLTWKRAALAGVAAALAAWLQIQMLIYVALLSVIFVADRLVAKQWRALPAMALAGAVGALLSAPLLAATLQAYSGDFGAMAGKTVEADYFIFRNRLSTMFLPPNVYDAFPYPDWNLLGWISQWLAAQDWAIHTGNRGYFGWVVLVLAFIGWRTKKGGTGFLAAIWLIFMLLSFGPILSLGMDPQGPADLWGPTWMPGPFEWLRGLPLVGLMRTPERFVTVAQLAAALLAGYGVLGAMRWRWLRGRPRAQGTFAAAVLLLHLADMNAPNRFAPSQYTPYYEVIAQEPGEFAVLDIPYGRGAHNPMHYGAYHQKGVIWGFASRMPREPLAEKESDLYFPMIGTTVPPEQWPMDFGRFARNLVKYRIRYIVVSKLHLGIDFAQPELGRQGQFLFGLIDDPSMWKRQRDIRPPVLVHEDDVARVYRIDWMEEDVPPLLGIDMPEEK